MLVAEAKIDLSCWLAARRAGGPAGWLWLALAGWLWLAGSGWLARLTYWFAAAVCVCSSSEPRVSCCLCTPLLSCACEALVLEPLDLGA